MTTQYRAILKNKNGMLDCKLFPIGSTLEDVKEWARGRGGTYSLLVTGGEDDEYLEVYRIKDDKMTYHGFSRQEATK